MKIYAIGTNGDLQKIGVSGDPEKRLKSLQTGNPEPLVIHYVFEVSDDKVFQFEKHIHKQLNHKRIQNEWFRMSKEEVINMMLFFEMTKESIEVML